MAGLAAAANLVVAIALAVVDDLAVALAVAVLLLLLRYDTNCQDSVDRMSKILDFNLRSLPEQSCPIKGRRTH